MRLPIFGLSCTFLLFLTVGCNHNNQKEDFIRPVRVIQVEEESPVASQSISGTVYSGAEVEVTFRSIGTISRILIKPGDYVTEGTLIATLDNREYEVAYQAAKSKYDQVNNEVDRVKELYDRKGVSKNDYEKALAGLQSVRSIYETAKYQLEDTKLYAPITGYVQDVKVSANQSVTPITSVATLVDTKQLSIVCNISSRLYMQRDSFESFSARSPLLNESYPLSLSYIAPKANNNQLYRMGLTLKQGQASQLAPGMIVEVTIHYKASQEKDVTIPLESVFGLENRSYVWIYDSTHSTVNKRIVELGALNANRRIVVLSGLKTGEKIVTAGIDYLREGQKVKLEKQPTVGNPTNQL